MLPIKIVANNLTEDQARLLEDFMNANNMAFDRRTMVERYEYFRDTTLADYMPLFGVELLKGVLEGRGKVCSKLIFHRVDGPGVFTDCWILRTNEDVHTQLSDIPLLEKRWEGLSIPADLKQQEMEQYSDLVSDVVCTTVSVTKNTATPNNLIFVEVDEWVAPDGKTVHSETLFYDVPIEDIERQLA